MHDLLILQKMFGLKNILVVLGKHLTTSTSYLSISCCCVSPKLQLNNTGEEAQRTPGYCSTQAQHIFTETINTTTMINESVNVFDFGSVISIVLSKIIVQQVKDQTIRKTFYLRTCILVWHYGCAKNWSRLYICLLTLINYSLNYKNAKLSSCRTF